MAAFNGVYQLFWLKLYLKALPVSIRDNQLFMNVTCRTEKSGFLHIKFWFLSRLLALLGFRLDADMRQIVGSKWPDDQPVGRIYYDRRVMI